MERHSHFDRLNLNFDGASGNPASGSARGVQQRGAARGGRDAGLRALVLSALPIVRAGISRLIRVEFGDASRVLRASWSERDEALAAAGGAVELVVAHPDSGTAQEVWPPVALAARHAAIVVALPGSGSAHRPPTARAGVRSVALEAQLGAWRQVLRAAVAEARSGHSPAAGANGAEGRHGLPALAGRRPANRPTNVAPLTQRQHEVYEMLRRGLSNKNIADQMDLSVGTVKLHVAAVLHAMNARNRVDIVLRRARGRGNE